MEHGPNTCNQSSKALCVDTLRGLSILYLTTSHFQSHSQRDFRTMQLAAHIPNQGRTLERIHWAACLDKLLVSALPLGFPRVEL